MALLLNHLWQSSLFVGGAALMALALRKNGAHVRFWLWFAASIKFLVPFAGLTALSAHALAPMLPPLVVPPALTVIEPIARPFALAPTPFVTPSALRSFAFGAPARAYAPASAATGTSPASAPHAGEAGLDQDAVPLPRTPSAQDAPSVSFVLHVQQAPPAASNPPVLAARLERPSPHAWPTFSAFASLTPALLMLWIAGVLFFAVRWLIRWIRIRALVGEAEDAPIAASLATPVAVKYFTSRLEPGLVGILSPVILLPQGIERQLSPQELRAVLAHELCHWRRRDNLLAAIHMMVEVLFWFFPLVWWVGTRLNAERERACDECVLADGNDPRAYAEAIVKVCRAYLQVPLGCVAGISQGSLKDRIAAIMENVTVLRLNARRKWALGGCAATALALPLALGLTVAEVAPIAAKAAPMLALVKVTPAQAFNAAETPAMENPASEPARQTHEAAMDASETPMPERVARRLRAGALTVPPPDLSQLAPAMPELVALNEPPTPLVVAKAEPDAAQTVSLDDLDPQSAQLLTAAETFCADNQVSPSDARYLACLDIYLSAHSVNLVAKPVADGSVRAGYAPLIPHSVGQLGGQLACGSLTKARDPSPDEFQKCLDRSFALQCAGAHFGASAFQVLNVCHWQADEGGEGHIQAVSDTNAASDAPVLFASSEATNRLRQRQAFEARGDCESKGQGPSDSHYMQCVNRYLKFHYGWEAVPLPDGSVVVGIHDTAARSF